MSKLVQRAQGSLAIGAMHNQKGWFDPSLPRWFMLWMKRRRTRAAEDGYRFDFESVSEATSAITADVTPWEAFRKTLDTSLPLVRLVCSFPFGCTFVLRCSK